jgi:hypothetical protein
MDRLVIETSDAPEVIITKIQGSLRLKGWDRPQIRADIEVEDTLKTDTDGNTVTISCQSGCLLRVPSESSIEIDTVTNDLVIKSLDGAINVKQVDGQISVKSISSFSVENAHSNFNAKHIEGNINCTKVAGNASVHDVDGDVLLKKVHGNLTFSGTSSNLDATTFGNANLELEPESGGKYKVISKGSITYRVEPFTNATISMKAKGGKIRLNIPDNKDTLKTDTHELVIGEGDSEVTLEATGNIEISSSKGSRYEGEFILEDLSQLSTLADDISLIVTSEIENQMDSISQHISDLTSNLSNIDVHTSDKARRKLESQRRNLERKLASVERKAHQKARTVERRIEHKMRARRRGPASDPVSDEERQKVLEMLQAQQISVEEAEVLLAALEGRTPETSAQPISPQKPDESPSSDNGENSEEE